MFLSDNNGRNLTIGSTGSDVWAMQVYLITNNILSPAGSAGDGLASPTSYFGDLTKDALAAYQAQADISPANGFLGSATRDYLEGLSGTKETASPSLPASASVPIAAPAISSIVFGASGPDVTAMQNILTGDGYLSRGTFTVGTFDIPTLRAVETFQCVQSIACEGAGYGIVGPKTRAALGM
jgi:peptidoglycan hydrolase-like protein with peptidoglycan-binding domain